MKFLILLLVAPIVFGAFWQTSGKGAQPAKVADMPTALVDGNNQFAVDLYHRLAANGKGDVFVSPQSISLALAMTYAGAAGQTAEQMAATLHFTLPREELNAAFARLLKQWTPGSTPRDYELNIANRLWAQQGYKFLDSFLKITRDDFGAELAEVDFVHRAEAARQTINAWVAKQTADKIKDLIGSGALRPDTRLVLTNAIYFRGQWQSPFEVNATKTAPFHISADKTADVQMMHHEAFFRYGSRDDLQILEMPYKGSDLS
ncbi:MAG TPA: serpin family protein, partial [Pirellulales bacterium]|nr:serpin family protein [Pirellulales bacterium]